jgi:hypothetical protein
VANTEALKSVLSTCRKDYYAALQQINLMEDLDVPSRAERVVKRDMIRNRIEQIDLVLRSH